MLTLRVLPQTLAICRLAGDSEFPEWASASVFSSVTRTPDELSIVCEQALVPAAVKSERDWRAIKVEGALDFALTGILASIAKPLAKAKISLFAVSTFDTDYILVKSQTIEQATAALAGAGFKFI
ncbi:MAG: ACT domain-containing protein [Bdellovibrionota bacterium]